MKKVLLFSILMLIVSVTAASAGILGTITGYVQTEALSLIIGGILGALGMFGVSYKLWGQVAKELGDCLYQIYMATRSTSNGGKEITKNEMASIIKEATEIYPSVQAALASRKIKNA